VLSYECVERGGIEMPVAEPRIREWTTDEYYKMASVGLFDKTHVELIEGSVVEMSPMGSMHWTAVVLVADVLRGSCHGNAFVATQVPLTLGDASEPEPDIAVIRGNARDYRRAHPSTAELIVEVADTSLEFDRTAKASLYAKAGIEDYWILNLVDRQLEVQREPVEDDSQPHGFGYSTVTIVKETGSARPLNAPHQEIAVADLLP